MRVPVRALRGMRLDPQCFQFRGEKFTEKTNQDKDLLGKTGGNEKP
jgi:hypothetical protein